MFNSSPPSFSQQFKDWLYQPILGYVLEDRRMGWGVIGISALHFGLNAAGFPAFQCPFLAVTGVPCPGCGLSRGVMALGQGDWRTSLTYHAFALPILVGLLLVGVVSFLPRPFHTQTRSIIAKWESQTGFVAILLLALVFYWLVRLLFWQGAFLQLIASN
jgi:hypothetical protein